MPDPRKRMAESMHGRDRIGCELIGDGKKHARRAEREKRLARRDRPKADGARRAISRAARHDHAWLHTPSCRQVGGQLSARRAAFDKARHLCQRHATRCQNLFRPSPPADIKPERAGGVRHVLDHGACQAKANIGLWQQHLRRPPKDLRFVIGNPKEFGCGETGHGQIAGNRMERRQACFKLATFNVGATVIPQDRRAQGCASRIEQSRAMHLTGETTPRTAATATGWVDASSSTAPMAASTQESGFCSDHSGWGCDTSRAREATTLTLPAASTSTALTLDVPISSPRYTPVILACALVGLLGMPAYGHALTFRVRVV